MQLQNPLWDYALKLYASDVVQTLCLRLQDEQGLSVNRLLYAGWLTQQHCLLDASLLDNSSARYWQQQVTSPLRAIRYEVREAKQSEPHLASLYKALREAELEAERVELAHLYSLKRRHDHTGLLSSHLMERNLGEIALLEGQQENTQCLELLRALGEALLKPL